MQKLFFEVGSLDKRCYEEYFLSEDLLMEQAAISLVNFIKYHAKKGDKIVFICGFGNNGADGIASARILDKDFKVSIFAPLGQKSLMSEIQLKRAKALHVEIDNTLNEADIYVDCIFGSGLKRELNEDLIEVIRELNKRKGLKIACDIPTGIKQNGGLCKECFESDFTITMGALKEALYSDGAKDYVGEILVSNLGVSRENYEVNSQTYVLEETDVKLPYRDKKNTHKGNFGHVVVLSGNKEGASILSATSSLNFGAGLITLVSKHKKNIPASIMQNKVLPAEFKVLLAGMGLGNIYNKKEKINFLLGHDKTLIIDADLFYDELIVEIIEKKDNVVLTPHPKEFANLLKLCGLANISITEVQKDRFKWARVFSMQYPEVVLLLKGANTIICHNQQLFVNPLGNSKLAKGGSGDILAGMIGALIAQNYTLLDAAIHASLAHSICAKNLKCSSYGLNPLDLIEGIKCL